MILALLMLLAGPAQAQDHTVAVTVDVDVKSLGKKEIRRLFTGQAGEWSDGRQVNLILPPMNSAAMAWLSSEVLGLPPALYHRYLLEKAYRAGRPPPKVVGSMADIVEESRTTPAVLTVLPLPVGEGFHVVRIN